MIVRYDLCDLCDGIESLTNEDRESVCDMVYGRIGANAQAYFP